MIGELHENEQYFFDAATCEHLAKFLSEYKNPCCLCAPAVGRALSQRGSKVSILDRDERFADLPGFRRFDVLRPEWTGEDYDIILCDPPFFGVSLSQLSRAIKLLSRHDYSQPLLICYLKRRENKLLGAFSKFTLQPTGYFPGYETVRSCEKNEIEFFSNLSNEEVLRLRDIA